MKHQSGYAFTLLLLLAGCGGGSSSDESGTTQLNLAVSDAPVDSAQQVCIAVSGLRLKQEGVNTDTVWNPLDLRAATNNDGCLPEGYTIPTDSNGNPEFLYLDLLNYQDGIKHPILSDTVIPSGTYEQLRLTVLDGTDTKNDLAGNIPLPASYVKDDSGNILPLYVPSSELKFHNPFTAVVNGVLDYQVEFNLRHAMVLPGNSATSDHYKLKPNGVKLLAVETLSTIQGNIDSLSCGGNLNKAGVYLYSSAITSPTEGLEAEPADGGPINSTLVNNTATPVSYEIHYVEPGSYNLALVCNAADDIPSDDTADAPTYEFVPDVEAVIPIVVSPEVSTSNTVNFPANPT
ncbi:MAG: DUF4382 domain-containing protein [Gammaproteobacteria bacterium]|nr:DUF4382 domain-containing protein [Gammaproteobacteria bacterium]